MPVEGFVLSDKEGANLSNNAFDIIQDTPGGNSHFMRRQRVEVSVHRQARRGVIQIQVRLESQKSTELLNFSQYILYLTPPIALFATSSS